MKEVCLFAHRGFTSQEKTQKTIPQNSLQSLENAMFNNFNAIEFDIWIIENTNLNQFQKNQEASQGNDFKLLIKHDKPLSHEYQTLPAFKDFLKFGNSLKYWLDFKNADEKNSQNLAKQVFKQLNEALIEPKKVIIAPFLTDLKKTEAAFKSFQMIFGEKLSFACVCEEREKIPSVANFMQKNHIKFLSINHKILDKSSFLDLSNFDLLAWTVNETKRLTELIQMGVRNFATDLISNHDLLDLKLS